MGRRRYIQVIHIRAIYAGPASDNQVIFLANIRRSKRLRREADMSVLNTVTSLQCRRGGRSQPVWGTCDSRESSIETRRIRLVFATGHGFPFGASGQIRNGTADSGPTDQEPPHLPAFPFAQRQFSSADPGRLKGSPKPAAAYRALRPLRLGRIAHPLAPATSQLPARGGPSCATGRALEQHGYAMPGTQDARPGRVGPRRCVNRDTGGL
jgi:hypothetical protein